MLNKNLSHNAFERWQKQIDEARKRAVNRLSANKGYLLEMQFMLYCDNSVWDEKIDKALETLFLSKLKFYLNHA